MTLAEVVPLGPKHGVNRLLVGKSPKRDYISGHHGPSVIRQCKYVSHTSRLGCPSTFIFRFGIGSPKLSRSLLYCVFITWKTYAPSVIFKYTLGQKGRILYSSSKLVEGPSVTPLDLVGQ